MRKTIESSSRFTFDDRSSDDCSDGGLVYLTVLTVPPVTSLSRPSSVVVQFFVMALYRRDLNPYALGSGPPIGGHLIGRGPGRSLGHLSFFHCELVVPTVVILMQ
jgi:hypothetical protein